MTAVSKVTLNGTTLMDATSATATASEIISPYTAMTADGVMTTGTGSGGGGGGNGYGGDGTWTRPMGYPKLDDMDITGGDVVYMSYIANEALGFCDLTINRTSGSFTFEIGEINNGVFTADSSTTYSANTRIKKYFGSADGGYKVIKIAGSIKEITTNRTDWTTYDGEYRFSGFQGIVEIYGKLPHMTKISFYGVGRLHAVHLGNAPFTSLASAFYNNYFLESVDTKNWDVSNCTEFNYTFANCNCLNNVDVSTWNTGKVTTCQAMFLSSGISQIDISGWNMSLVTNTSQMFQSVKFTEITIPASLGTISANMFSGDNQKLAYHFKATTVPTLANTNAFNSYHTQMVIYVPSAKLNDYKTANNWSTYASYMVGE